MQDVKDVKRCYDDVQTQWAKSPKNSL